MRTLAALLTCCLIPTITLANWPQFRGPDGQGHADTAVPTSWSETENVTWKTAIPGRGWSSPVVWGNQVWLTTAIETEATEEAIEAYNKKHPSPVPLAVRASVVLKAVCVDVASGEILHDIELFAHAWPQPVHSLNSFASPTPIIEARRVYCDFGAMGLACIDTATGTVLWRKQFDVEHIVGPGSSPVIYGENLILTLDGADRQFVVAVNKTDGNVVWKTDRPPIRETNPDFRKSYATPLVIQHGDRPQLISPAAQWLVSLDPATGEELWRVDYGPQFSLSTRPLYDGKRVYICTGFMQPQLWAVDPQLSVAAERVAWTVKEGVPNMASPLVFNSRIYVLHDGGVMRCLDSESGVELFKRRVGGSFSASLLLADEHLYAFDRKGKTTVFATNDEFTKVAVNQLDGKIMATPAVVDNALVLRTDTHLYRIE